MKVGGAGVGVETPAAVSVGVGLGDGVACAAALVFLFLITAGFVAECAVLLANANKKVEMNKAKEMFLIYY